MSRVTDLEEMIEKLQIDLDELRSLPQDNFSESTVLQIYSREGSLSFAVKESDFVWGVYTRTDEVDTLSDALFKAWSIDELIPGERLKWHD